MISCMDSTATTRKYTPAEKKKNYVQVAQKIKNKKKGNVLQQSYRPYEQPYNCTTMWAPSAEQPPTAVTRQPHSSRGAAVE
jgi:hypothetical protein